MKTARRNRSLTVILASMAVMLAGAALAQAATTPSADPMGTSPEKSVGTASLQSVDGKVISSSASSLVVETDAGKRLTFDVDSASAQPASLAAGDRVTVRYRSTAGIQHADDVTLAAAAPIAATASTSSTSPPASATESTAAAPSTTADAAGLPRTASPLPLILLVGTLAALVAFGVHLSREREGV